MLKLKYPLRGPPTRRHVDDCPLRARPASAPYDFLVFRERKDEGWAQLGYDLQSLANHYAAAAWDQAFLLRERTASGRA